jgi:hypothetical protein
MHEKFIEQILHLFIDCDFKSIEKYFLRLLYMLYFISPSSIIIFLFLGINNTIYDFPTCMLLILITSTFLFILLYFIISFRHITFDKTSNNIIANEKAFKFSDIELVLISMGIISFLIFLYFIIVKTIMVQFRIVNDCITSIIMFVIFIIVINCNLDLLSLWINLILTFH